MRTQYARQFSRRRFLGGLTLAGTAGLLGWHPRTVAAEPPPETTRLRLSQSATTCTAPVFVAEELLHGEGFSDVQYIKKEGGPEINTAVASGEIDLAPHFGGPFLLRLEAGDPIVTLAGLHIGCMELVGTERVRALRDLKGKTVAVRELGTPEHLFLASMAAYVGLDPRTDIHWVFHPMAETGRLLAEGNGAIARAFTEASSFARGKRIRVVSNAGEFQATTAGLEPSGALRVKREDGPEELLVAGEIFEVK